MIRSIDAGVPAAIDLLPEIKLPARIGTIAQVISEHISRILRQSAPTGIITIVAKPGAQIDALIKANNTAANNK